MTTEPTYRLDDALRADRRLRAIDAAVRTLVALAPSERSGRPLCSGCVWEQIVKPLTTPALGNLRGLPHVDARESSGWEAIDLSAAIDDLDRLPPPTGPTEEWLRSMHAYDLVTDVWLDLLYAADPANGHGLPIERNPTR